MSFWWGEGVLDSGTHLKKIYVHKWTFLKIIFALMLILMIQPGDTCKDCLAAVVACIKYKIGLGHHIFFVRVRYIFKGMDCELINTVEWVPGLESTQVRNCTQPHEALEHYCDDVTMGAMASQITRLTIVYSTVYSGADKRKHQSSASLAFVGVIHRGPVNSPHKLPVKRKMLPFDGVIMIISISLLLAPV